MRRICAVGVWLGLSGAAGSGGGAERKRACIRSVDNWPGPFCWASVVITCFEWRAGGAEQSAIRLRQII